MFGRRIPLFTILGFQVKFDTSWLILVVLITWTLADGVFPHYYKGLATATYWYMGIVGALGLFLSIVVHELFHSLVAKRFNLPMKGITLFVFGGVAEMSDEPPSARAEFFMAIAGPLTSVAIGFIFWGIHHTGIRMGWPASIQGITSYLRWINFVLAAFNMLPAFPLDGGRVLRSIIWGWKGKLQWATWLTSRIGAGFGLAMIFIGILNFIGGNFIGGLWLFLIGLFLRNAAQMSYQQVITRTMLEGEPVRRFMRDDPVVVPPSITLSELVENYIYKHHFKMYPVVEGGALKGCISTREVKEVPRQKWDRVTVAEAMSTCGRQNTISPDDDAVHALAAMNRSGNSRLLVIENGSLAGIITLKDLLQFLSVKMELEQGQN